jgi:hypothetical protein
VNLISDHIGIQYLTVQQFAFILTAGPPKWFSNISILFTSLNMPGNIADDEVQDWEDYAISSEFSVDYKICLMWIERLRVAAVVLYWNDYLVGVHYWIGTIFLIRFIPFHLRRRRRTINSREYNQGPFTSVYPA